MFVQVIPRLRLVRKLGIFDYAVPADFEKKIAKGSLVLVPFRRQIVWAVVVSVSATVFQGKKIRQIVQISPAPHLPAGFVDFLLKMSGYYAVSPALLVRFALPEFLKRRSSVLPQKMAWRHQSVIFPKSRQEEVRSWLRRIQFDGFEQYLFHYFLEQERFVLYWSLIKRALHEDRQIMIIVPEVRDIYALAATLPAAWRDELVMWHGGKNKTEAESSWRRVVDGRARIIIGTSGVVWLPLARPGLIIVDQEQDAGHKQSDHNPRFAVHDVARERARQERFPLIFTSHWPGVVTFSQLKSQLVIRPQKVSESLPLSLINLTDEFTSGSFHFLTGRLLERVRMVLSRPGSRVFFFFNKKGFARRIYCRDCSTLVSCPGCAAAALLLGSGQQATELICHACVRSFPIPTSCVRCGGTHLVQKGFGVRKIAHDLEKIFPDQTPLCLDKESSVVDNGTSRLIVGTEFAVSRIDWSTIDTMVFLSADDFPFSQSWASTEAWTATLSYLLLMARSFGGRQVIVQSFDPEQWWLRFLLAGDYDSFQQKETEVRRQFIFPPQVEMIRILCYAENQEKSHNIRKQVEDRLNTLIDHKEVSLFIGQGVQAQGKKFFSTLLLKSKKPLLLDFSWLPETCFLDRNPLTI